jgi:branched-chain amino acid transport system substrate-binding protein
MGDQVFNLHAGNATEASVLAQAAIDKGWKAPYLLVDTSNDYTTGLCDLFGDLYDQNSPDGAIAGEDTFVQTDQSVTAQVNRIKEASDVDVIVLCSYPPGGASVVRQLRSAGIDTPILTGVPFDGKFWIEAVPDVTDVYHTSVGSLYGDDPRAAVNEFWVKYAEKYGEAETTYPLFGYIAMQILATAGEMTGGVTTDGKLADAIETITDGDFILGPTTYTPTCHAPLGRAMTLMRWVDGVDHFDALVTPSEYPQLGC